MLRSELIRDDILRFSELKRKPFNVLLGMEDGLWCELSRCTRLDKVCNHLLKFRNSYKGSEFVKKDQDQDIDEAFERFLQGSIEYIERNAQGNGENNKAFFEKIKTQKWFEFLKKCYEEKLILLSNDERRLIFEQIELEQQLQFEKFQLDQAIKPSSIDTQHQINLKNAGKEVLLQVSKLIKAVKLKDTDKQAIIEYMKSAKMLIKSDCNQQVIDQYAKKIEKISNLSLDRSYTGMLLYAALGLLGLGMLIGGLSLMILGFGVGLGAFLPIALLFGPYTSGILLYGGGISFVPASLCIMGAVKYGMQSKQGMFATKAIELKNIAERKTNKP